jgi:hypothetical protein
MNAALILRRASASRSSGVWNQDDFDVLADGAVRRTNHEKRASLGSGRVGAPGIGPC